MLKLSTPSITPAQIAAVLTFAGGQAVAFGLLSSSREQTLVSIGSIVLAAAWKLADAWIRHGRSKAAAVQLLEQTARQIAAPTSSTTGT